MSNSSDPDPKLRLDNVPNLCSYGMRPHLMTGALVQFLRQHFAARTGVEEPSLRDCLWRIANPTGIVIEASTNWKPAAAMQRPAVVVKRGAWQVLRLGINDKLMGYLSRDGSEYFTTFMRGTHTLFCLADEPGQAERLAAEVYREFMQFGPKIRLKLQLHRFVVAEVGALGKLQEATDSYAVPVTVAYVFEESWVLAEQTPALKRIVLDDVINDSL